MIIYQFKSKYTKQILSQQLSFARAGHRFSSLTLIGKLSGLSTLLLPGNKRSKPNVIILIRIIIESYMQKHTIIYDVQIVGLQ